MVIKKTGQQGSAHGSAHGSSSGLLSAIEESIIATAQDRLQSLGQLFRRIQEEELYKARQYVSFKAYVSASQARLGYSPYW